MDNPNPEPPAQTTGGFDGSNTNEPTDDLDSLENAPDAGGGNSGSPFENEPFDAGVEASEETDPTKYIQQLSGKLGQSIRDYSEKQGQADLELEKFAINSVVSATHTADMTPEDRNDIIKKINKSGSDDKPENDGFGDTISGEEQEDAPTEENFIHEIDPKNPSGCLSLEMQGIGVLPKDHKQVFVNAKLGVDEKENKKMDNELSIDDNIGIFGENLKTIIMKKIHETFGLETPVIEPKTIPIVKPDEQPTRRQKPWRISPNPDPEPKAEE